MNASLERMNTRRMRDDRNRSLMRAGRVLMFAVGVTAGLGLGHALTANAQGMSAVLQRAEAEAIARAGGW